ncbi:hypothetical protein GFY24_22225 [Nocardia sp. SYP-A9097]|uniref:hypothetical protein n=1 Tax=Nocardia sp. SYP-A9097 TaxID=2663237 RepID=UPI00129B76F8|nr:hypothetical protein [Nocardia sp. SYP-A9097]MRH90124.1 hypothetical protein [Nocardia sp. SYP-A9097]
MDTTNSRGYPEEMGELSFLTPELETAYKAWTGDKSELQDCSISATPMTPGAAFESTILHRDHTPPCVRLLAAKAILEELSNPNGEALIKFPDRY